MRLASKHKSSTSVNKGKRASLKKANKGVRHHKKYGTSKLEDYFAENFLDKLGVRYVYQFEAKDIGRFYDFGVILGDGDISQSGNLILIEIDGGFYHSDPRVVDEANLSPMQKRNKRVDEYKNKWALMHGIPIIRIWEKDIHENPKMVMDELKKRLHIESEKIILKENKGRRHVNKIR